MYLSLFTSHPSHRSMQCNIFFNNYCTYTSFNANSNTLYAWSGRYRCGKHLREIDAHTVYVQNSIALVNIRSCMLHGKFTQIWILAILSKIMKINSNILEQ